MYKNIITITKAEIENLNISAKEKYEWVDFVLKNKKNYILPVKTRIPLNESDYFNVMPCVLPSENILGLKVVTRNANRRKKGKENIDGDILLYSYEDFLPLSLIDGSYITTIRTAAIAVHSMLNFMPSNLFDKGYECKISMLGLGNIGNEIGRILFEFLRNKSFTVKLYKYKDQAEQFIEKFSNYSNIKFEICNSYDSLMSNSDVIFSSITFTENDFCSPTIFKKPCIVIPVHLRGFKECDKYFDQVITSDLESIKKFENYNYMKKLLYIDDIILNKENFDINKRSIIYNLGLAIYDLFFASKIYKKIKNAGE